MCEILISSNGWNDSCIGKLLPKLRRAAWKLVNLLVVLAMLLPNFTFFVDQALAAEAGTSTEEKTFLNLRPNQLWKTQAQEAGTPEPTATATITATAILSPTGELTPTLMVSVTPTATSTPTVTTTPTPDPTATWLPTATPLLTPTATLDPTPVITLTEALTSTATPEPTPVLSTVELLLEARPSFVTPGGQAFIDWEINGGETLGEAENLTLLFTVPAGFEPHKSQMGDFDPISSTLDLNPRIEPDQENGKTHWQVSEDFDGPYLITAELYASDELLASAEFQLESHTTFVIRKSGGQAKGLGGRVKVTIPNGSLDEDIDLEIKPITNTLKVPYTLSGSSFEINAYGHSSKKALTQFKEKIVIELTYMDDEFWGDESGLSLFYFDENLETWVPLPSEVDKENNTLRAWTDHFTDFDVDIQDWQAAQLPNLDGFQVSQFTGAAAYNVPFWVPPGPGGLQPNISLSYNSQTVDQATSKTQASWVGMGWNLNAGGYIKRNMNGTMDTMTDDTFSIVTGGVSGILIEVEDGAVPSSDVVSYRIQEDQFWRIWAYKNAIGRISHWEAWDKVGNHYTFGGTSANRAEFPYYENKCSYQGQYFWNWGLAKIDNVHGKSLVYEYDEDVALQKNYKPCEETGVKLVDLALNLKSITYPNDRYRIVFNTEARYDYDAAWNAETSRYLFENKRLDNIEIIHNPDDVWENSDDETIRRYDLVYADNADEAIFTNYQWPNGGIGDRWTSTLVEVQEIGLDGISFPVSTSFVYGNDMHLTEAANGYGGSIKFEYERWYSQNSPQARTKSNWPCANKDWIELNNTSATCDANNKLVIKHTSNPNKKGRIESKEAGSYLFMGGGVYRISVDVNGLDSPIVNFGFVTNTGVSYESGDVNKNNNPVLIEDLNSSDPTLQDILPETWKFSCYSCKLTKFNITLLPIYYRVTSKTLYDSFLDTSNTHQYSYDEPALNDAAHSELVDAYPSGDNLYTNPNEEFRGHAMEREETSEGLVTTTYFHQDDLLKGRAHTKIISEADPVFATDSFENLDTAKWNYTHSGSNQMTQNFLGDKAFKSYSPDTGTNVQMWDKSYPIRDAEGSPNAVMVQFRLESTTGKYLLFLENEEDYQTTNYRRWGVTVDGGVMQTHLCIGPYFYTPNTLFSSPKANTWYVLLLIADDDNFYMRVWERDHPSTVAVYYEQTTYAMPAGDNWHFTQQIFNGTTWLDEYSEGNIYSIGTTTYTSQAWNAKDIAPYNNNYDLDQYTFVAPSQQTQMTFNGDASWEGTQTTYKYETSRQGGSQYGNTTEIIEAKGDQASNTWQDYRMTVMEYYPETDGVYLVGLPGYSNQYECPDTGCDDTIKWLKASTWNIYDDNSLFNESPIFGKLTGQRTYVCQSAEDCFSNANYQDFLYNDVKFEYDAWGNQIKTYIYDQPNTFASFPSDSSNTNYQLTTTCYGTMDVNGICLDDGYHTYPKVVTNNAGQIIQTTYDPVLGIPTSVRDANGVTTYADYDQFGRMTAVCRPLDGSCGVGNMTNATIQLGYNEETNEAGDVILFWTEATQKLDEQGAETRIRKFYNGLGQLLQTQNVDLIVDGVASQDVLVDYYYDSVGRLWKQSVPYAVPTGDGYRTPDPTKTYASQTTFDDFGRVETVTATDGTPASYSYDDLVTSFTDAKGNTTKTTTDVWERTVRVEPPEGPYLNYIYDAMGRLVEIQKIASSGTEILTTELEYDYAGRKVWMNDPDMGEWFYTYDALGNLIHQTDAKGQTTCLYYDEINRSRGKTYPDGTTCSPDPEQYAIEYRYDESSGNYGVGRRTSMQDPSGTTNWEYDKHGRLTQTTRAFTGAYAALEDTAYDYTFSYTYNIADQMETITYPDGEIVTTDYNANGQPVSLSSDINDTLDTYVNTVTYDEVGRLKNMNTGNGLSSVYEFYPWNEQGGRLKSLTVGGTLLDLSYAYGPVGNIQTIEEGSNSGQKQCFSYDALSRLTQATTKDDADLGCIETLGDGNYHEIYTYDDFGRLDTKNGLNYEYPSEPTDPQPHAVTAFDDGNYVYDANGNMTTRTEDGITYNQAWTKENKLARVEWEENGISYLTSFVYDGDGNRLLKIAVRPASGGDLEITTVYIGGIYEKQINTTGEMLSNQIQSSALLSGLKVLAKQSVTEWGTALKAIQKSPGTPGKMPHPIADTVPGTPDDYAIIQQAQSYRAANPAHALQIDFAPDGQIAVGLHNSSATWLWKLSGFGREGSIETLDKPTGVTVGANRIAYQYQAGLDEWYFNDQRGLEQGFTLQTRPAGNGLVVLEAQTNLLVIGNEALLIENEEVILTYVGLRAWDADGIPITASLKQTNDGLRITLDDRERTYPITVDPLAQSPYWEITGQGGLGSSITFGDFNGDGYSDLAASLPSIEGIFVRYSPYSRINYQGSIAVWYGSSAGLGLPAPPSSPPPNGIPSNVDWWVIRKYDYSDAQMGCALASDDFDGDGYDDLAVGVCTPRNITTKIRIWHGNDNGLGNSNRNSDDSILINPEHHIDSMASGDFDGDSYADLAIGHSEENDIPYYPYPPGNMVIVFGSSSGFINDNEYRDIGSQLRVGDLNNDGIDEILIAPYYDVETPSNIDDSGANSYDDVFSVCSYINWGLECSTIHSTGLSAGSSGAYPATADLNADGYHDLIISIPKYEYDVPNYPYSDVGMVFVWFGPFPETDNDPSMNYVFTPANADWTVPIYGSATAGDINNDGVDDLIVSDFFTNVFLWYADVSFLSKSGSVDNADWQSSEGSYNQDISVAIGNVDSNFANEFAIGVSGKVTLYTSFDVIAPETTAQVEGTQGNNDWYISPIQVTFAAEDDIGGSGIKVMEYGIWDEQANVINWQVYTEPLAFSSSGTIYYRAQDRAGNIEIAKGLDFKVDPISPAVTHSIVGIPGEAGWYRSNVTVTLTVNDPNDFIDFHISSSNNASYSKITPKEDGIAFVLDMDGFYTISYRAIDEAHPEGEYLIFQVIVDKTSPTVSFEPADGAMLNNPWPYISVLLDEDCVDYAPIIEPRPCIDPMDEGCSISEEPEIPAWCINPEKSFFYLDNMPYPQGILSSITHTPFQIHYPLFLDLIDGPHAAYLRVYDRAGNKTEALWHFTVDTETWGSISAPLPGTISNQETITLTVDVEAGELMMINLSSSDTGHSGTYTTTTGQVIVTDWPLLSEQENEINLEVQDQAGNIAQDSLQIVQASGEHSAQVFVQPGNFSPTWNQVTFMNMVTPYAEGWQIANWEIQVRDVNDATTATLKGETPIGNTWMVNWDGKQENGEALADGTYGYQLSATLVLSSSQPISETIVSASGTLNVDGTIPTPPSLNCPGSPFSVPPYLTGSAPDEAWMVYIYYQEILSPPPGINAPIPPPDPRYEHPYISAKVSPDGRWAVSLPLTQAGDWNVFVTAIDTAGNESIASEGCNISLDSADMIVDAGVSPAFIGINTSVALTATANSVGAEVAWIEASIPLEDTRIPLQKPQVADDYAWMGTWITPGQGNYTGVIPVVFEEQDRATPPNQSQVTVFPYLDLAPPWLHIERPLNNATQTSAGILVSGRSEPFSTIWITTTVRIPGFQAESHTIQVPGTATASGAWQAVLDYGDGHYEIVAQAVDRVGNPGSVTGPVYVTVDSTGPEIRFEPSSVIPYYVIPDGSNVSVNAQITDLLDNVNWVRLTVFDLPKSPDIWEGQLSNYQIEDYQWQVPLSFPAANIEEGFKDARFEAADWVRNTSTLTITELFLVDGTPPTIALTNIETSGAGIYLAPRKLNTPDYLYYSPEATGVYSISISASDQSEIATAGLDTIEFPEIFGNDAQIHDLGGAQTVAITQTYQIRTSPSVAPIIKANVKAIDRARSSLDSLTRNEAATEAFYVLRDVTYPNISLTYQSDNSNISMSNGNIYYGVDTDGASFVLQVGAGDPDIRDWDGDPEIYPGSGLNTVTFPPLFEQPGMTITETHTYQTTYPIHGFEYTFAYIYTIQHTQDEYSGDIVVTDNVENNNSQTLTTIYDDAPPTNAHISVSRIDTLYYLVSWGASDNGGSGVGLFQVEYQINDGSWQPFMGTTWTSKTQEYFIPEFDHTYTFRVRSVKDWVGNMATFDDVQAELSTQSVTKYYHFGGQRVAMRQGTGAGGAVYYLHGDHLGSTSLTTDAVGAVVAQSRNYPFGKTRWSLGTAQTDFAFTGQRMEAGFGLMDYNARYYSPKLGRFISPDTLIPNPGNPMAFDRYAYAYNNPLYYTDPSGHAPCFDDGTCYENGRFIQAFKSIETHPYEFFLNDIYRSPVRGDLDDSLGFGQARGTYDDTDNKIYHPGIDEGNTLGVNIYAVAPGKVVYADYNNDLGYTVIIEHDVPYGGYVYSIYAHLGEKDMTLDEVIFVTRGQVVDSSTHIGEMGNTKGPINNDATTSTHLHFEVRTSLNVDKSQGFPLRGQQWWINQDGGKSCSPWTNCWLDLGMLYGYDPTYDSNIINGNQ